MIVNAYTIYDRKGLIYHPPFFQLNNATAVRVFEGLCNDPSTFIGTHPNDYVLYRVGSYDDARGQLIPLDPIEHVRDGNALVRNHPDLFKAAAAQ